MRGPGVPPASMPERVGRYEVLCPIASGGMATVYLGRARGVGGFERDVAIKLPHRHALEVGNAAGELVAEAKLAVALRHPNIVTVLDVGEDEAGVHLVMDYVEGESLNTLVAAAAGPRAAHAASTGPESPYRGAGGAGLPLGVAMRILLDVLAGLHAAHELRDATGAPLSVVHRDVSPQNILVGLDGVTRLADFGVAKVFGRGTNTRTGTIKGKVAYMAPEQARGQVIDRRCDVWAAGVVAWELVAARRLRASDNDAVNLLELVTEPPPHVGSVRPEVPEAIGDAIAGALCLEPEQRTPDAQTLAVALREACRVSGVPIAEPSEVAARAASLIGSRVRALRERADAEARARAARSDTAVGDVRDTGPSGATSAPAHAADVEEVHTLARGAFVRGVGDGEDETTRRSERQPSAAELGRIAAGSGRGEGRRVASLASRRSSVVTVVFASALAVGTALAAILWTRSTADASAGEARAPLSRGVEASVGAVARAAAMAGMAASGAEAVGTPVDQLPPAVPAEVSPSRDASTSPPTAPGGAASATPSTKGDTGATSAKGTTTAKGAAAGKPPRPAAGRAPDLAASPYARP